MFRILCLLLLACLAAVWEYAVGPFLPSWFLIHPFVPLLVLLLAFARRSSSLFLFAAFFGVVLDALVGGYGLLALEWRALFVAGGLVLLSTSWFSNRSVYALLTLTILIRVLDWLLMWGIFWLDHWLGHGTAAVTPFVQVAKWMIWDVGLVGAGFIALSWLRRWIRPYLPTRFRS